MKNYVFDFDAINRKKEFLLLFVIVIIKLLVKAANIIILYSIVKRIYSIRSAFFAVLIFIYSFYFNVISGLFILPDTPQVFFVIRPVTCFH